MTRAARLRLVALLAALACMGGAGPAPARAAGTPPPHLQAATAILVVASTGEVAYADQPDRERPIASTTKLMTALLTLEHERLSHVCTAPAYDAGPLESRIDLRAGERMTVADLLRALLLPSANDAAATLATCVSGSVPAFVDLMNRRAHQLGLDHTHYANPVGLDDPGNYSTARDLVTLAIHLRRDFPFFRQTVDRASATLQSGDHTRTIRNRNTLVGEVPWVNGVKTGHTTKARYVLVGSGTRHGVTLVSAVLGEPTEAQPEDDTLAMLRWGMGRYRAVRLLRPGAALAKPRLRYRDGTVDLVPASTPTRVLRRGVRPRVVVDAPDDVLGPLKKGARVGRARVYVGHTRVATVPLVTRTAVPEAGVLTRLGHYLSSGLAISLILVVGICSLLLGLNRRRANLRRRRGRRTEAA